MGDTAITKTTTAGPASAPGPASATGTVITAGQPVSTAGPGSSGIPSGTGGTPSGTGGIPPGPGIPPSTAPAPDATPGPPLLPAARRADADPDGPANSVDSTNSANAANCADSALTTPITPHDPCAHGFLPERPPVRSLIGTWTRLDAMARAAAIAPDREAAVALVERARRAGELAALRQRVSRLSLRNAEAAAMRVAVIAVSCGWCGIDPQAPAAREVADEAFLDLWAAIAHRIDHDQFVALPTLALHNWAPERKPRRHIPIDQLARTETLVPIVRWAPEGQPLSRLDRLMLAATRLEAHGIWLFRLAETLAGRSPDDSSTPTALRRLVRVQHALRGQLLAEAAELSAAPATPQQRAVLGALVAQSALEPPVLQAADAVLGIGARRLREGRRQLLRRHLPAQHRAWLSAMDRHCAPVRTLAHRGGPDAAVYREAQESLIALRRTYTALVQAAARPTASPLTRAA
ncbi:hypothetical protein [Streptomyces tubercidicus]|uniref:Uncharacterized protein n=1 Tax=Streptomyces tubercidicus TaxID=47759 RepID=A0A640UWA9_9ACTN|nr:hypothetical protein [Streptomyces tubercidicus]WAU13979.1 hypothetical protein STRTU_004543 [Streptomyces tubercidicus]GFE39660.1 hypothetical protein Stube_43330 [Streptomyces tubercidicus]